MSKHRIDYLHITGANHFETDSVFELYRRFEELLEDEHVSDSSLKFFTQPETPFKHEPLVEYVPTEKDLEYERFKGGRK